MVARPRKMKLITPREYEVMRLVAMDLNRSEIAAAFGVTSHSIKLHVANVRRKLKVRGQVAAVVKMLKLGLLNLDDIRLPLDTDVSARVAPRDCHHCGKLTTRRAFGMPQCAKCINQYSPPTNGADA